ncbi:MAG: transporter substrate-binding domain-containing protein [Devosia sp.]|jgi:polar amino acid transport system substrate-binding protein|uniref:transporter substrate-binding domain-containing protein n=1 Tax=unclassified Devosia TaxID=196773 RepID=UPI000927D595|nr:MULTISPECIES: transporter substrate-binding domain-containing protein [unclassified Devosia]MBL8597083.1 transporter substrate-binding domain-containing protein [Devosia sp.]MBN9345985.1 transporter substrate-binding domain-containing protein [Devosia sp.]OJX52982.1 MAG: amino acid ABC transporter [Devosia sp. 66-22]
MKHLILAAAALLALSAGAQAQDTVRLGSEGAYPPYNYVDEAGKLGGFDIDVGNEICKRAGLTCEWVVNEWDTIIPNLIAGNYDAILAGMSITDERKKTIAFTQDYFPPDPSAFVAATGKNLDLENPSGLRFGAQGATIQAAWLEQNVKANNTVLSYETPDQALADLNAGNLDAILADKSYLQETVAGSSGALELTGPEIEIGGGVGIGMRQADTELTAKFDAALTAMKADGTLDALITLYFPDREGGPFYTAE